jgi:hypothetical protein
VIESHGTFYWLKVWRNGDTSSRIITPDWEFEEWSGGYETSTRESATGWHFEVRFDREELTLDGDGAGAHVYGVHDQGCSTWAWPLEFDRSTMGELRFEQVTIE